MAIIVTRQPHVCKALTKPSKNQAHEGNGRKYEFDISKAKKRPEKDRCSESILMLPHFVTCIMRVVVSGTGHVI